MYYDYTHEILFRNSFNGWYLYNGEIAPTLEITKSSGVFITNTHSEAFYEDAGEHECIAQTLVSGTYNSNSQTIKVESWYEDWYPLGYPWDGTWEYDYNWT